MMDLSVLWKASELGQSIWCDFISRDLIDSDGLLDMVSQGVRGVTSNPAIFKKSIGEGQEYDGPISAFSRAGLSTEEIYEELVLDDVGRAADVLLPVFQTTGGLDGYVSLEVDPRLADDRDGTVEQAVRLKKLLGRPNVMIKIPATEAGIAAIEEATSLGISVNATLIFSLNQSRKVNHAYIGGLEKRLARGEDVSSVRSVASLFVSRLDSALDPVLEAKGLGNMVTCSGVDNARLAYAGWREVFSSSRWGALSDKGACPQRMLWASTGTKSESYRDTFYVEELMGPYTVNTVPPATMRAFMDHGVVEDRIGRDLDGAASRREGMADSGIDLEQVTSSLMEQGVSAFVSAFDDLMGAIKTKASLS
nr:transaldolase [uncultured Dethiosulfovibrio sp.]